jgi:hypothetical protein
MKGVLASTLRFMGAESTPEPPPAVTSADPVEMET